MVGAYQRFPLLTILAAFGLVGSAIYGMVLFQSAFQGQRQGIRASEGISSEIQDLSIRELLVFTTLLALLIIIGFYPNLVLEFFQTTNPTLILTDGIEG